MKILSLPITLCIQTKWTKQLFTNNWFEHDSGRNNWIYNNKSKVFTKYNRPSLNNLSAIAKLNTGRLVHWLVAVAADGPVGRFLSIQSETM